jgi:hypothetical protein
MEGDRYYESFILNKEALRQVQSSETRGRFVYHL